MSFEVEKTKKIREKNLQVEDLMRRGHRQREFREPGVSPSVDKAKMIHTIEENINHNPVNRATPPDVLQMIRETVADIMKEKENSPPGY